MKNKCRVKNIVRNGEIACYKQFSFSHNVFYSCIALVRQKVALCGNGLRCSNPEDQIFNCVFLDISVALGETTFTI